MAATNSIFSANPTNFANRQPVPQAPNLSAPINALAQPQCNLIWVNSKDEVLNHPAAPNETLYFGFSGDDPVMWIRETDGTGRIKNPLHKLRYSVEEDAFGPEAQFVTKAEHKELFDLVAKMNEKLDKLDELLK
jgi:hypothetical protein